MTVVLLVLSLIAQAAAASRAELPALMESGKWAEILQQYPPHPGNTPDILFARGLAHARLQHWDAARAEFESGRRAAPREARFPIELAGVAFRQGRNNEARKKLELALRLRPGDPYATDFLAAIHLLNRNTRAALRVWNTTGKPRVENVAPSPAPELDPVVLDRALAVRPAGTVRLKDYDASMNRLDLLGIFQRSDLELVPRRDGNFDLEMRLLERPGLGQGRASSVASLLRGLPYSTAYPELYNLRRSGLNLLSMIRWDPHKRRAAVSLAAPLAGNPGMRVQFDVDARDEDWDTRVGKFDLRRIETGASIVFAASAWRLRSGAAFTSRQFTNPGPSFQDTYFRKGSSLEYRAGVEGPMFSWPERRLEAPIEANVALGRRIGEDRGQYSRISAALRPRWFPQAQGEDFGMAWRIEAGAIGGTSSIDDLFSFGLERDNPLGMRGHRGTVDGRKGAGPLGTAFVLASWELDKKMAGGGLWQLTAGPFVDSGRIWDRNHLLDRPHWLTDAGLQCKLTLLHLLTLKLSFTSHLVFFGVGPR
jgi:hypothetical protein